MKMQPKTQASPGQKGRCFVLMPFRSDLDDIYALVKKVCAQLGLKCWRADEVSRAGNVFGMILEDIKQADVVITDLTGRNPNVFYETAVAHMQKAPRQVILLAQSDNDVPFDLQALRYLKYANNAEGRHQLNKRLKPFIVQALAGPSDEIVETIEGDLERTRRIVADLNVLVQGGPSVIGSLKIRIRAGLSSLAIADSEVDNVSAPQLEYKKLLLAERNALRTLLQKRASLRGILSPPTERYMEATQSTDHLGLRYRRLIAVLEGRSSDPADESLLLPTCKLVLSPFRGNNTLILGERLLYDGIKTNISGGFDFTTRVTHPSLIQAQIRAFDTLFDDARRYTLETFASRKVKAEDASAANDALLTGLKRAYAPYKASLSRMRKRSHVTRVARKGS